jgi:hypothetical protein
VSIKLAYFPVLLVAACVVAGAYGAVHNQVLYTVSPEVFEEFVFPQFNMPQHLRNRAGASLVGIQSSWWMGLVIGLPVLLIALTLPGWKAYLKHSLIAFAVVAGTALLVGLAALGRAYLQLTSNVARAWMVNDFSYIGGAAGIFTASAYLIFLRGRLPKATTLRS